MVKKRFNWKSRQIVNTVIDDSATKKIQLDLKVDGHYDQSNELVLPSKKRKTKIKEDKIKITKILSKKHRKKLEKIVERKKKKENRASLLEALSQVQTKPEELNQLTSIASIQTKGLKRYFQEELNLGQPKRNKKTNSNSTENNEIKLNSIKGRRKLLEEKQEIKNNNNPNIVGFESSSESSDQSDDDQETKKDELNPENDEQSVKEVEMEPAEVGEDEVSTVEIDKVEVSSAEVGKLEESSAEVDKVEVSFAAVDKVEVSSAEVGKVDVSSVEIDKVDVSTIEVGEDEVSIEKVGKVEIKSVGVGKVQLKSIEVDKVDVSPAKAGKVEMTSVKIGKTQMTSVEVGKAQLNFIEADKVDMSPAMAGKAQMRSVEVSKAQMRSVEVSKAQMRSVGVGKAQMRFVEVGKPQLKSVGVGKVQLKSIEVDKVDVSPAKAGKVEMTSVKIGKTQMTSVEVGKAQLKSIEADKVDMSPANAGKAQMRSVEVSKAQMRSVEVGKAQMMSVEVGKAQMKSVEVGKPEEDVIKVEKKLEIKPAVYVDVVRTKKIQKQRLKLPILAEEQKIMEIINENSVIIIAGETGSGKTTQIPQFLYEAGYAINKQIGITEPRRVAAISMSKRVAEEMNLTTKEVSYLIRFEGNVTEMTKIKFMTDGVLLKEIQNDFLLNNYSVIILDEAHERTVYTDILIGLLSRIVPLRQKYGKPLKLIIMSATLRLEDFTLNSKLFHKTPPSIINVDTRQFPVTVHFNRRTNFNYLKDAFNKTVKIHQKLPEGGILIFLTGQQEVNTLVKRLRKAFPLNRNRNVYGRATVEDERDEDEDQVEEGLKRKFKKKKKKTDADAVLPRINLDDFGLPGGGGDQVSDNDDDFISDAASTDDDDFDEFPSIPNQPLWVLPLYSLLPSAKQAKIFETPPTNCRLCVVSTNVAETSLTIPHIKYVIDCGKTKMKLYDKMTGVSNYIITWISKASANQRAGRAGRLGPGHCYRLYSSAVFNDFHEFNLPEIQRKPVDDLYLQMKCMNIDKIINFPFPTTPDLLQLKSAMKRLEILGALTSSSSNNNQLLTKLGRAISKFPVLPRFGKMLALSHQQNLLPYTICLVAALSVQEVLLEIPITTTKEETNNNKTIREKWFRLRRQWAGLNNSLLLGDCMVLLKAVGAAEYANSQGKLEDFCNENGLRQKALIEIRKLRLQLSNDIKMNLPEANVIVDPKLQPPNDLQAKLLRQILLSGMGDQIARKIPTADGETIDKNSYQANNMEQPVFLHRGSVLKKKPLPEFVIYQEIYETTSTTTTNNSKIFIRGLTAIEPEWLPIYVPKLCNLSPPLNDPEPFFSQGKVYCTVTGTFGSQAWPLPNIQIEFPLTIERYKWFARFLLEGKVFDKLRKFVGSLLSQPSIMVKSWGKLQLRTDEILNALVLMEVSSKDQLEVVWLNEPKYLLKEYLKWLPESAYSEASLMWPPLDGK